MSQVNSGAFLEAGDASCLEMVVDGIAPASHDLPPPLVERATKLRFV